MNPFRARKKTKGAADEIDGPPVPKLSGMTFRRNKKQIQAKPELDLATVLPSSDDFRTSLLMPKMSARFSMLREQDDPSTLLGKASDDSVLPKRTSRFGVLTDIMEAGPIRPPFAEGRSYSNWSADGYATDDDSSHSGSVMSRARPGEGNVLFGGRQKVYKIPAGGSASNRDLTGLGGRFLYEHDVHMSAFQGSRQRERARSTGSNDDDLVSPTDVKPRIRHGSNSPTFPPYDRNRETSSSTASVPSNGRTSTAATSVASQGAGSVRTAPTPTIPSLSDLGSTVPERSLTKGRRLYEHGLDLHIHEQQSSALSRLDQLSRQRAAGASSPPPGLNPSGSHANTVSSLREPFEGPSTSATKPAALGPRALSPPPPVPTNLRMASTPTAESSSTGPNASPDVSQSTPVSPVGGDGDGSNVNLGTVRPWDRSPALSNGQFPKPKSLYDDHQYSQRQLQMQHERKHSPSPKESPPRSGHSALSNLGRRTTESNTPSRAGSGSSTDHQGNSVKSPEHQTKVPSEGPASHGTFLANLSGSESSEGESEGEAERQPDVKKTGSVSHPAPSVKPHPHVSASDHSTHTKHGAPLHPALASYAATKGISQTSEPPFQTTSAPAISVHANVNPQHDLSPPDLSGLVRQHMRTDSGQSSTYGASSPRNTRYQGDLLREVNETITASPSITNSGSPNREPWASSNITLGARLADAPKDYTHDPSLAPPSLRIKKSHEAVRNDSIASQDVPANQSDNRHVRHASTETEKEREAVANELAQRRRVVQENMKSIVQAESRATSPSPDRSSSKLNALKPPAFGTLKPKSSQSSLGSKSETASKAMKMLGISTVEKAADDKKAEADRLKEEEDSMLRSISGPPKAPQPQTRNWGQIRRDARKQLEQRQREAKEASIAGPPPTSQAPSPPSPPSSSASSVDRSGADTPVSRSWARFGRSKENLPMALQEATPRSGGRSPLPRPHTRFPGMPPPGAAPNPPGPRDSSRTPPVSAGQAATSSQSRRMPPPGHISVSNTPDHSRRPSPISASSASHLESLAHPGRSPTRDTTPLSGTLPPSLKRPVQKRDISEPKLVCSTSDITTLNRAPAVTTTNVGRGPSPPPVPPINPRRRTRGFQMVSQAFGRSGSGSGVDKSESSSLRTETPSPVDEGSPADGDSPRNAPRLWKTPSEGMTAGARPRHPATNPTSASMPAVPQVERRWAPAAPPVANGAMF